MLKAERPFFHEDHESEISKWLKFENDPVLPDPISSRGVSYLPPPSTGMTFSSSSSNNSSGVPQSSQSGSSLPSLQSNYPSNYSTSGYGFMSSSGVGATTTGTSQSQPQFSSYTTTSTSSQYAPVYSSSSYSAVSNPFPSAGQYAPAGPFTSTISLNPSQLFSSSPYSFSSPTSYSSSSPNGYTITTTAPNGAVQQQLLSPQVYQLFSQFLKTQMTTPVEDTAAAADEKKRRSSSMRPFTRRVRQTRPKVVEAKGAVQCRGRNRKKASQCRNAALMEYIGPRPVYCAEHIELDPNSLYEKCKSAYQKEPGDNKGCKEVVLKEFGVCYKHYADMVTDLVKLRDAEKLRVHYDRITDLLNQLEREATAAKKKDGDLYQRKNKLIPKFQEMKRLATKGLEVLEDFHPRDDDLTHSFTAPVLDISICMGEPVTPLSSEDEDILSSPSGSLSEDDMLDQFSS